MLQKHIFFSIIIVLYYDTHPALLFLDQKSNQLTLPQENCPGKSPIAIAFINILLRILEILLH
jgi:hypothetical protein